MFQTTLTTCQLQYTILNLIQQSPVLDHEWSYLVSVDIRPNEALSLSQTTLPSLTRIHLLRACIHTHQHDDTSTVESCSVLIITLKIHLSLIIVYQDIDLSCLLDLQSTSLVIQMGGNSIDHTLETRFHKKYMLPDYRYLDITHNETL